MMLNGKAYACATKIQSKFYTPAGAASLMYKAHRQF